MREVVARLLQFAVEGTQQLVGLLGVELCDTHHLYLEQTAQVIVGDRPDEFPDKRLYGFAYELAGCLRRGGVFETFLFVDTVFDEYLLQRDEEILLFEFPLLYLKFPAQQVARMVG